MATKSVLVNGLVDPHVQPEGGRVMLDLKNPPPDEGRTIHIADARAAQDAYESPAEFFRDYGFVLLRAPTTVKNWDPAAGEVESIYFKEVEGLIRDQVLPGEKLEVQQTKEMFARRGIGTENPSYASGVHQDFGWHAGEFQESVAAFAGRFIGWLWRLWYARPWVRSFLVVNFWRTTNMTGPLQHMPLVLADPRSVRTVDLIPLDLLGITPTGRPSKQMALRFHEDQRWYWYPAMRPDEVLVFKLFECCKDDTAPVWRSVFHAAFEDPDAVPNAELRQSCEHRVQVMHLR